MYKEEIKIPKLIIYFMYVTLLYTAFFNEKAFEFEDSWFYEEY